MIQANREGDVITLELQREDRRNALSTELCQAITDAVTEAVAEGARALVITGKGPAFCAGADLSGSAYASGFTESLVEMLRTVESAPVPVIAAVNGPAIGAGCQLAIVADLRIVDPSGYFAIPAARLGLAVDRWTIHRLSSLIGGGAARGVLLAADRVDSARALELGLANRLGTLAQAQEWAREISQLAPLSLRHTKMVFNDDGAHAPSSAAELEALAAAWQSEDAKEAREARAQKRPPVFRGV